MLSETCLPAPNLPLPSLGQCDAIVAQRDVNRFVEHVMRDDRGERIVQAPLHRQIQAHLSYAWAHGQHALIVAPPEHGKSVQIVGRLLWELGHDPNKRIAVISGNEALALDRVATMRRIVMESEAYRETFPHVQPLEGDKRAGLQWTMHRFYIERSAPSIDPSVQAAAAQGKTEGKRIDLLWADDFVTRADWTSDAARKASIDAWETTWEMRLGAVGRAVLTNNAWHKKDLIHVLRERPRYAALWVGIPDSCDQMNCEVVNVGGDYEIAA